MIDAKEKDSKTIPRRVTGGEKGEGFDPIGFLAYEQQGWRSSTPKQSNGVSLGMTTLLYLIGISVGPVIAGIFMQANQALVKGTSSSSGVSLFPTAQSYNLILLTAILFSIASIVLVSIIKKRAPKPRIIMK